MRITCPECSVQFNVPDGAITEKGRKLRCSSCKHQWHQMPVEDEPDAPKPKKKKKKKKAKAKSDGAAAEVATEAAAEAAVESAEDEDAPADADDGGDADLGEEDGEDLGDDGAPGDDDSAESMAFLNDLNSRLSQNEAKPKKRRPIVLMVLGALIVLLPVSVLSARSILVGAWPPSALLYDKIGMGIPLPGEGLVIQNVGAWKSVQNELTILQIKGELRNNTEQLAYVPTLRVSTGTADGMEAQHWLYRVESPTILPGETTKFEAEFANPAAEADRITVTFSTETVEGGLGY
ncbi:MAG: hypothetical protein HOL85_08810 [Rhodospirillaceae bacterium]|nr:hypothetical protein [Rhodospirillaceae bacterium]MBT6137871.1 hypothetical protein [Rhodospirillaceae bacterium]